MSGIFGCLNFDGAPVDRALLERMRLRLAHRGPDGAGLWCEGPAGLGHLALNTTPESVRERQPLTAADGKLCLTLDGRVDNRGELLADLRAQGFEPRDDTDAELVLQAWHCWGEGSPARILGDFVFAIWDCASRRLFCARDVAGVRQLHYFRDSRTFIWATEWRALFEHPAVTRAPDEAMAAQFLCATFSGNEATIYRDVRRLPPAHAMSVEGRSLRLRRYWEVDLDRRIRHRGDEDYAQHFRSVFRDAVQCRLRSRDPVAADLSGGLDSSSVVGMVQSLRTANAVTLPGFEVFSLIFPGQLCDERPYIEAVAAHWKLEPHYCEAPLHDLAYYRGQVRAGFDLPAPPNLTMQEELDRRIVARGMRVRLCGLGGDEWLTSGRYLLADLVRKGELLEFVRTLREIAASKSAGMSPRDLLRYALWPQLPLQVRLRLRRLFGREGASRILGPALQRHRLAPEVLCQEPASRHGASFDQVELLGRLESAQQIRGFEESERSDARHGIESRMPFLDRRVIEFAFALPARQRWRGGLNKLILRNAMAGLLPEAVAGRSGKAEFSFPVAATLRNVHAALQLEKSTLSSLGWLRQDEAFRIYNEELAYYNRSDCQFRPTLFPMWWMFGIEMWMNEVVLQP